MKKIQCLSELKRDLPLIFRCVMLAFEKYMVDITGQEYKIWAKASMLQSNVLRYIRDEYGKDVRIRNRLEVLVLGDKVIRFNKVDETLQKAARNNTNQTERFYNQETIFTGMDLLDEVLYEDCEKEEVGGKDRKDVNLVIGWALNSTWTKLLDVYLIYPQGTKNVWVHKLEGKMVVMPKPQPEIVKEIEEEEERRFIPKRKKKVRDEKKG